MAELPNPQRGRVLIIDDEVRLAHTLRIALSSNHEVDLAHNGRQALERLRGPAVYDVVLCDMLLPDISGAEVFETIRREAPELVERFVFLTGGAFAPSTRDFLRDVPNEKLEKPFDLEALEALVEARVRARRPG